MCSSSPSLSFNYLASLHIIPLLPTLICSSSAMLTQPIVSLPLLVSSHPVRAFSPRHPRSSSLFSPAFSYFTLSMPAIQAVVCSADSGRFFCELNYTSSHMKTCCSCVFLSAPDDKYHTSRCNTYLFVPAW